MLEKCINFNMIISFNEYDNAMKAKPNDWKNTVDYVSHDFVAFQSLHLDSWVDLNDCKSCPVADYMFDTKQALDMVNPS